MRAATANPSHLWFLLMLMIYGIAYAFGCGKGWSPKIACPTLLGFFVSSIVLGSIAFVVGLFFPTNSSSKVMAVPLGLLLLRCGGPKEQLDGRYQIEIQNRDLLMDYRVMACLCYSFDIE